MAYVCFIDEAGCPGVLPTANSAVQPALVLVGLFVESSCVNSMTAEYLELKRKYFPSKLKSRHLLDDLLVEIKGSDLRSAIRKHGAQAKRHLAFVDETLGLVRKCKAQLVSVCWTKGIGKPFDGRAIYTRSIQTICEAFESFLAGRNDYGVVIADYREPQQNAIVAHSVFTQRHRAAGDAFPHLIELHEICHSQNHEAQQINDLLSSAILFPTVTHVYCTGFVQSVHVHDRDGFFKVRYMRRIKALQYVAQLNQKRIGGVNVFDAHGKRPSTLMFSK
jgi:hypothetical protein